MSILILAGGPDGERDVSLKGAEAVRDALEAIGAEVHLETIETITSETLARLPGDVVLPLLHGPWGEGGPLQDLLLGDERPFVGSGPRAARLAMDKIATKIVAASLGAPTPAACVLTSADAGCPFDLPVVVKPVREGSTLGLHVCRDEDAWLRARAESLRSKRPTMVEPLVPGREITAGWLDGRVLPLIEIGAAEGLYDYAAKYERDDTRYIVGPSLPAGVSERIGEATRRLCAALGVRHIARADFMLDPAGTPWLLEVNTMPGFTDHSLVPMAAATPAGGGLSLGELAMQLIAMAKRDASRGESPAPGGGRALKTATKKKRTTASGGAKKKAGGGARPSSAKGG
jgi:D-alanine-D-alanine ligase